MDNSAAAKIMMASGGIDKMTTLSVTENHFNKKAEHNKPPAWNEVDLDIPVDDFVGERNATYKAEDYELEAWTSARAELGFTSATFTQNGSKTADVGFSSCHIHINTEPGRTFENNDTYTSTYPGGFGTYSIEVEDNKDKYDEAVEALEAAIEEYQQADEDCQKRQDFARWLAEQTPIYYDVPATRMHDGEEVTMGYDVVTRFVNNINGGTPGHPVGKADGVSDIDTIIDLDATYTENAGTPDEHTYTGIYVEAWHNHATGTVILHAYSMETGEEIRNPNRPDGALAVVSIPTGVPRYAGSHVQVTSFSVTDRSNGTYVVHTRWANGEEGMYTDEGVIVRGSNSDIFKDFGTGGHRYGIRPALDHNYRNWDPPIN